MAAVPLLPKAPDTRTARQQDKSKHVSYDTHYQFHDPRIPGSGLPQRRIRHRHRPGRQRPLGRLLFLPRRLHVRLPYRAGGYGRAVRAVPGDGRGGLFGQHRFPLRPQGMARRLGKHPQDRLPDARRPDRRAGTQLRRDDRAGRDGLPRHLRRRPRGADQAG